MGWMKQQVGQGLEGCGPEGDQETLAGTRAAVRSRELRFFSKVGGPVEESACLRSMPPAPAHGDHNLLVSDQTDLSSLSLTSYHMWLIPREVEVRRARWLNTVPLRPHGGSGSLPSQLGPGGRRLELPAR